MVLVRQLLNLGHEVTALCRTPGKGVALRHAGARVKSLNALDARSLAGFIRRARPAVIINQLTAIPAEPGLRRLDRTMSLTNRLRTEATATILDAAKEAGTRRLVQQSFCGWTYEREGGSVKTEADLLMARPPWRWRKTLAAIRHLEEAAHASDLDVMVLRYGFLYGPGTGIARDGTICNRIRRRQLPLIGEGQGVWSFVHVNDAARATVAAALGGSPGIYNIVDDEPGRVCEWLPHLAEAMGAKPPPRIKPWLARLIAGRSAVLMMTANRGASNAKARQELGWRPNHASWRHGFSWMFNRGC